MSLKAIQNFIHNTYDSDNGQCFSEFSKEKSLEIIKLLVHKAPYLTFSMPYIGKAGSVMNEITQKMAANSASPEDLERYREISQKLTR